MISLRHDKTHPAPNQGQSGERRFLKHFGMFEGYVIEGKYDFVSTYVVKKHRNFNLLT